MFRFQKEQEIVNIAGVKIGGQPGELATALAGTIFYEGHSIVEDADAGIFDRAGAEALVNMQDSMSDETGNPAIVHIFANTFESMEKYIDFVTSVSDSPFIIDSPQPAVRMACAEYVTDIGLADKTIYNSINMSISDEECASLAKSDIDSSIILGFNAMDSSLDGRMALLENGGKLMDRGLLEIADECGITNVLIDPSITPMGDGAGIALRMTMTAKAKWGYPVGSGIHNAPSSWSWLKAKKKEDSLVYKMCDIGTVSMQQLAGGDFVLYGPIENSKYTFPLAAMADIMISEASSDLDIEPSSSHPLNLLV
ncbi:tetrahydromethanopterin S-methyltransferase subunit H [Methanococcoides methylutens]|uniref:Tetrahydromethanopterin S-methyltransferase subunit H n=1 Tax=Methanococcoides methylutens MM1 TaxID=1434104 RepID=A0A0E3WYU1_METMT|nr:tetrahydromethanopterin S-methyltransferase subunit H [Methanococcoides methylutens]AKB84450.1 Tetrahydromethanopterin S-methyltransferase subunit H [Methanococcoides methylutens MM1]